MTEGEFRSLVVRMLAPLAAFPVENAVCEGVPDICCSVGWIETKLGRIPKLVTNRVVVHVRQSQRNWLRTWARTGAKAWTLTLIDHEIWMLHEGVWSAEHLGLVPEFEMKAAAVQYWNINPTAHQLIGALIHKRHV